MEVAKTPRPVASKAKGKGKAKDTASKQDVSFEWLDGSVRDIALRTQILRGYEQFKVSQTS